MGIQQITIYAIGIFSLLGSTAAQTSVLQIPFIGFDQNSVDASVVTVEDGRTTLALSCAPGEATTDCGLAPTETVVTGPSTYSFIVTDSTALSYTQDCVPTGTSPSATFVCKESSAGTKVRGGPTTTTTTHTPDELTYYPVTVVAGASLLTSGAASAPATTTASSGVTESSSNTDDSGTTTQAPAASATSTTSTTSGNAAAATTRSFGLNKVAGLLVFALIMI